MYLLYKEEIKTTTTTTVHMFMSCKDYIDVVEPQHSSVV